MIVITCFCIIYFNCLSQYRFLLFLMSQNLVIVSSTLILPIVKLYTQMNKRVTQTCVNSMVVLQRMLQLYFLFMNKIYLLVLKYIYSNKMMLFYKIKFKSYLNASKLYFHLNCQRLLLIVLVSVHNTKSNQLQMLRYLHVDCTKFCLVNKLLLLSN